MQSPGREPVIDRIPAEPEGHELRAREDTVLAGGELRDPAVRQSSGDFAVYFAVNPPLDRHAPIVARIACRFPGELHQHCAETPRKERRPRAPTIQVKRTRPRVSFPPVASAVTPLSKATT
jgi:hypothetical protein